MKINKKLIVLMFVFFSFVVASIEVYGQCPDIPVAPGTHTVTYTTVGSSCSFTVPAGVTEIIVETWGGGAGGGQRSTNGRAGGGGGGAYARSVLSATTTPSVNLTPGTSYLITVGAGGSGANTSTSNTTVGNGGSSIFGSNIVVAVGGVGVLRNNTNGGEGGSKINCTYNDVAFSGGRGSNASVYTSYASGGGGGGAGTTEDGGRGPIEGGSFYYDGTPGDGGLEEGGNGGAGTSLNAHGSIGNSFGGGGGGGKRTSGGPWNGGNGAPGAVRITYTVAPEEVTPTKMVFTTQPSTAACPNANLLQVPVVTVQDDDGYTATGYTGTITLTNAGGIGMTGNSVAAVGGIATFTNLQFTTSGNAGILITTNGDGLTNASSTASVAVLGTPETPVISGHSNTNNSITWTWGAITGTSSYEVSFGGGAWTDIGAGTSHTASSLNPNQQYNLSVRSKNICNVTGSASSAVAFYTSANVPSAPTVANVSASRQNITINVNSNPANTEFAVYCNTNSQYIQANGSFGASAVWQTAADWGTILVSGLTQNTLYSYRVKARNQDGDETDWSTNGTATTPCGVETFPFFEGFETYTTNYGTVISQNSCYAGGGTGSWNVYHGAPNSGSNSAYFNWSSKPWLFIPLYLEEDAVYSFSAYASTPAGGYGPAYITVKYGTTATSGGMTSGTIISETLIPSEDGYTHLLNTFVAPSTGLFYIGIFGETKTSTSASRYLDDIRIEKLACPIPTSLSSSSVTQTTATISWTAASPAPDNGYQYYYSTSTTPPTEFTTPSGTVSAGVTSASLSSLSSNTRYYFWVRSDCGGGDFSDWVGSQTFRTECGPAATPFFEGFEDGFTNNGIIEGCYYQQHQSGTVRDWIAYSSGAYQGTWGAGLYHSTQRWLFLPVYLESGVSYNISAFALGTGSITISYGNTYSSAAMTNVIVDSQVLTGSYQEFSGVIIPSVTGTYYIGILGVNTSVSTDVRLDNISVRKLPTASISGTTEVCQNATSPNVTFTNPESLGVTIRYKINGGSTLSVNVAANSTATISVPTSSPGSFEYSIQSVEYQTSPVCLNVISGSATVTVNPLTVAGTLSGSDNVCSGSNSTTLSLSGHIGTIQKWQFSNDNWSSFSDISNTTSEFVATNLTNTTQYRVVVQSGSSCNVLNSNSITINVSALSVGGNASSNQFIVAGSSPDDISVTGYFGDVIEWQKDNNPIFSSPLAISVTNSTLTTIQIGNLYETTYYRALVRNGVCDIAYSSTVTITVHDSYAWTGTTSTNWSTPGNWNPASVPDATKDVEIPNVANKPIIGTGTDALAKNITLASGSTLTINQGGTLTVAQDLANNGTITVKSTAAGDGSLITNTISGSGSYKIERFLAANKWHLISSPITNALSGIFSGIWLRPYNETANQFGEYIVPTNIPLIVGQGFSNWTYNNEVRTFSGTVNNGIVGSINLPHTNLGWNLIGNPYPSAINWDAVSGWTKTNVANSVYVWNNNQYATYINGLGANGGSQHIAMGQGFFVQALAGGGSIAMNNNVRVHNTVGFMKNSEPANIIRVKVATNENSDESVIAIRSGVMDEFDYQFDATKLRGDASAPQLYTKKAETEAVICAYSDLFKVFGQFVYFEPAEYAEHVLIYTHTIDEPGVPVLFDHVTGATIYPNVPYAFTPTTQNINKRFEFIKASTTGVEENTSADVMVWESDKKLHISNLGNETLQEVKVYDMQGKLVFVGNQQISSLSHLTTAPYVVHVMTNQQTITKKIVLR